MEHMQLETWRLCVFLRLNEASVTYSEFVYVKYYELSIQCFYLERFQGAGLFWLEQRAHEDTYGALVE